MRPYIKGSLSPYGLELTELELTELMTEVTDFGLTEPKKPTGLDQDIGLTETEYNGIVPPCW
jgi:hypothetical protein